jgi:hypothetical protein
MFMLNINEIAARVKHNCNISDARFWGLYSPCGLLLRMRDLYRAEHNLSPVDPVDHKKVGRWIDKREELWGEMEHKEFTHIPVNGKSFSPFSINEINSELSKQGYVYAAGYGNMMKPAFMLARLSRTYSFGRYRVFIAGRELARDLATTPAMTRGHTIITRDEVMLYFFHDRYEDINTKNCGSALSRAFAEYGISRNIHKRVSKKGFGELFSDMVREETDAFVYHEVGEISQRRTLGKWWKELLTDFPYSRAELFLRNLKDTLADTCNTGMLSHIIEKRKTGSLHFYVALLKGFRKNIMPDLIPAYNEHILTGNWDIIEEARKTGHKNARQIALKLRDLYDKGLATPQMIEEHLMSNVAGQ